MKIFISHSSKDKDYGLALVELLKDLGIPKSDIIFTSKSGHGITKGKDIFEWLKNEIKDKPYVIYCLSDNYYSSIPCLNEMGAAWIIENDHMTLFLPKFEPSNNKFSEGAINPRELGVFVDKREDIEEFIDSLRMSFDLETKLTFVNSAILNYIKEIERLKVLNLEVAYTPIPKVIDIPITELFEQVRNESIMKENDVSVVVASNSPKMDVYTKFLNDIKTSALSQDELLLICYIVDCGKEFIRCGWMLDDELKDVRAWESVHKLDNNLSSNFESSISKFGMRKYLVKYAFTSGDNLKQYKVDDSIIENMLYLPNDIKIIINDIKEKHLDVIRQMVDDLPF